MQVFSSYFFCVTFLSVVILCFPNIVAAEDLVTTYNSDTATTTTASALTNNTGNNTSELPTTVVLTTTTSTVFSIVTEKPIDSTTTSTTTVEDVTNGSVITLLTSISDRNQLTHTATATFNTFIFTGNSSDSSGSTTTNPQTTYTTFENTTTPFISTTEPTSENTTHFTQTTYTTSNNTTIENNTATTPYTTTTDNNITTPFSFTPTTIPPYVTTGTSCAPLSSINLTTTGISKTEANISINGEFDYGSELCPTQIFINCTASQENNTLWSWVVQSSNVSFALNDRNYHDVIIGSLSEFTNYTCDVITDNYFYPLYFQTEQEVPSSPVDLNITILSSTSFNITWKEPSKIPSYLTGYRVTIVRKYVASEGHFWDNCSDIDTNITVVTENSFYFDQALPNFMYEVSVVANSSAGFGISSSCTDNTFSAASDPPMNVSTNLTENENNKNVELMQNFTWEMPCDTHGPVSYIQIELNGTYQNNNTRTHFINNITVPTSQNQKTYSLSYSDIWAATDYNFKIFLVGDITGRAFNGVFNTSDNYPSAPKINKTVISSKDLTITWMEPDNYPGKINNYIVQIVGNLNWNSTGNCIVNDKIYYNETVENTEFYTTNIVPDATYKIFVSANTSRGEGNRSNLTVTSNMTYPDPVFISPVCNITNYSETETYNATVTIDFQPGCFNGQFYSYDVSLTGARTGYPTYTKNISLFNQYDDTVVFALKPEYSYIATVVTNNTFNKGPIGTPLNFTAPTGVPVINDSIIASIPIKIEETQISLTLKEKYFDQSQGTLRYIAIIISNKNITGGYFYNWEENSKWPIPTEDATIYYQATPKFWNPFSESIDTIDYVIGNDTSCNTEQYCNKPLQSNMQYFVLLRLFNDNFYRNTMPVSFITEQESKLALILGSIGALLFLSSMGFILFVLWRKGYLRMKETNGKGYSCPVEDSSDVLLSDSDKTNCRRAEKPVLKTDISKKKFIEYCKYLEQNPDVLTAQWNELEKRSKNINEELPHHFAILPENQRKNRYMNILPFDHSRVKLKIDEDDEICSDFINASLIKGFSGENEYIATQGPKSDTCRDFWKMILQERVSIIVMVCRFMENNRDKCFKYFPNNRETMTIIGEDIEVRCSMELHFGYYCIRTLQVKKELAQETVTHMQFLDWPDFGVPNDADSMLNFCHQFKERWTSDGGMALVHCSAGVGRTGTIIATDILLRTLVSGRKIDVFNTVLELRRQRPNMVQTEKQYTYIYQLIRSMLEFPIVDEQDDDEHLYANVELRTKNSIVESAL